jgi:hypothetical protein
MATVFEGPWASVSGRNNPPANSRALIDLSPTGSPGSRGLFVSDGNLGFGYRIVADPAAEVWEALTTGADPEGLASAKPLVPTVQGNVELVFAASGLARRERFRFGTHPHTDKLRTLLRRQFGAMWDATDGADHCRRCLDKTCEKYGVEDWKEFVPQRLRAHVPGRLPHATTITESFNKADAATLGPDLTWTTSGSVTWSVTSNRGHKSGSGGQGEFANAGTDLSGDDHYGQAVCYVPVAGTYHGPACRTDFGAGSSFYSFVGASNDSTVYLIKWAGGQTNIATGTHTLADADVVKVEANGSTITGYVNTVNVASVTDTGITGFLRCGLNQNTATAAGTFDSFEAADLGGGGSILPLVACDMRNVADMGGMRG